MRIITCNVNGIRAAAKKGFFEWVTLNKPDIVCLQEVRAELSQLEHKQFQLEGYESFYLASHRKGYSGVGILTNIKPDKVISKLGWSDADDEARYLQIDVGKLAIVSIYLPSGSHSEERQQLKFLFMDKYFEVLKKQAKDGKDYIICGDFNIVHTEMDIKNFKSNQKNSGCLPEERAWLDAVFTKLGFVDAFRVLNHQKEQYTWWSNRGNARANNVGWRIDYQIISPKLQQNVKRVEIFKDKWFSDHAPLIVDYDINAVK